MTACMDCIAIVTWYLKCTCINTCNTTRAIQTAPMITANKGGMIHEPQYTPKLETALKNPQVRINCIETQ